jgi:hypothetical protein
MKEDHMLNGQLKPGYNIQISSENQFVLNYTIHPNPTDTLTLSSHLDDFEKTLQTTPKTVTADAGYGSEENYVMLEAKQLDAYVKYSYFDKEQGGSVSSFASDQLHYNADEDYVVCPMGQHMNNIGTYIRKTSNGFEQTITKYEATNCNGCPLRTVCHKSSRNRIVEINHNLRRLKKEAGDRLRSDEGIEKRKKRCADVEPVFANWKQNKGFRRFHLRGKEKVSTEIGLLATAHNLQKMIKSKQSPQKLKNAA